MKKKKKLFRCLLCDWKGTDPKDIESMEPGNEGWFRVCPVCSENPDMPTEVLILYLQIDLFSDDE